ncbi:MAG: TSUP family transporter [Marinobacterium sp.]|nr:TSUP family transporter [Marinobacterium sp.]
MAFADNWLYAAAMFTTLFSDLPLTTALIAAALTLLVVTLGIALQAVIGIGFGLVAAPLLFLINPAFVPVPILIAGTCLSLIVVLHQRQQQQWRRIMPAILARLPGAWLGAWLLLQLSAPLLGLLFGGTLLLAVLLSLVHISLPFNRTSLCLAGFSSGLIGTATSVGGPPMALVYQHQPRLDTRNELAAFFLLGTPGSIVMLALQGGITTQQLQLSVAILPGVILGYLLARLIEGRWAIDNARKPLLVVSGLSALLVLVRSVQGLG